MQAGGAYGETIRLPRLVTTAVRLRAISATGPARKVVEGNRPEKATQGPDGTVTLKAEAAELYGDMITFEPKYRNLGYWSATNDRAAWSFDVTHPGRFEVWLDRACDDR